MYTWNKINDAELQIVYGSIISKAQLWIGDESKYFENALWFSFFLIPCYFYDLKTYLYLYMLSECVMPF